MKLKQTLQLKVKYKSKAINIVKFKVIFIKINSKKINRRIKFN